MNTEAHLAVGWILAHLGGRDSQSRRFRGIIVLASLIPDIDTIAFFFGERAYANYHHAIGHNVFFLTLCSVLAALWYRQAVWKVLLMTQIALYSHYFGDYFLTRFPLEYFWPLSEKGYIHGYGIGLDHPINNVLSYLSFILLVPMAMKYKRTPMEFVSVDLDNRIVNLFRYKPLTCHICGRKSNELCTICGHAACQRHGRINRRFVVVCSACHQ